MRVLVVNAGSSSVKLRVVEADDSVTSTADLSADPDKLRYELDDFLDRAGDVDVAGHRVVHGGPDFTAPVVVDDGVRAALGELDDLAPLHNPPALAALDEVRRQRPGLRSVACFDTAFHAGMIPVARRYALPDEWVERWGVRRYGFHGLSCAWSAARASKLLGTAAPRLVICHLGGGASVTAAVGDRSVDTSMGFTPVEGLVMGTRSGSVDPGALAWLLRHGVAPEDLDDALEHRSGLLALSGGRSSDMRDLLEWRSAGDERAALAVGVYLHHLRAGIAAMAAALDGLDALVFTGGVGEHAPVVRAEVCDRLGWLGVGIDHKANEAVGDRDAEITAAGKPGRTLVVHAREDLVIAAACRGLVAAG